MMQCISLFFSHMLFHLCMTYTYAAPELWNSIPHDFKHAGTIKSSRHSKNLPLQKVMKYLLESDLCSILLSLIVNFFSFYMFLRRSLAHISYTYMIFFFFFFSSIPKSWLLYYRKLKILGLD